MLLTITNFSELRNIEHPMHSILSRPWLVVTIGGLGVMLQEIYCECGQVSLQRRYFADKLALIAPLETGVTASQQKDEFLNAPSVDLLLRIQTAPAWLTSERVHLRSIQSNFPKTVRSYFSKASNAFVFPFAPHSSSQEGDYKVLVDTCPQCRSILAKSNAQACLSLLVATGSDDNLNLPIPLVCSL